MSGRRFRLYDHQGKAAPYVSALKNRGWLETTYWQDARFLLLDTESGGRHDVIQHAHDKKIPSFIFPHAGVPQLFMDYPGAKMPKGVRMNFVLAAGHKNVMQTFDYAAPIHVAGWSLCNLLPFDKREPGIILFAPIHPNANKFLCDRDKETNYQTYHKLRGVARQNGMTLKVRYIFSLEANGLHEDSGVSFMLGRPEIGEALAAIEKADVVVSHHTFAYLAIARGVPTVMMAEDAVPLMGNSRANMVMASHWKEYRHLMMYPHDIFDGDPAEVIAQACGSDKQIRKWRTRMIGRPFDGDAFVDKLEACL